MIQLFNDASKNINYLPYAMTITNIYGEIIR